jgi:hypothetical protein
MGFIGSHLSNILEQTSVPSWRNIKRGSMVYANYNSEKTGKSSMKLYLVLHPYYGPDLKMHVLDMDYISPDRLKKYLIKHTLQKAPIEESFRGRKYSRLEFKRSEMDMYNIVIRPLINDGFGPSYRTIFPMNLTKIKLVHYEFLEGKKTQGKVVDNE